MRTSRDWSANQRYSATAHRRDGAGHPHSANNSVLELETGDRFSFVVENFKDCIELSDLQ